MSEDRETPVKPDDAASDAPREESAAAEARTSGSAAPAAEPAGAVNPAAPAHDASAGAAVSAPGGAPVDEEQQPTTTEVLAAVDRAGVLGEDPAASGVEPALAPAPRPEPAPVETREVIPAPEEMPSAGPSAPAPPAAAQEQITISSDHPMAALYMQTPMPPDLRGNRGAGVAISLLATIAFAIVLAAALAVWRAPFYPPSAFLDDGLVPWILSWGFLAACVGYFVMQTLLVLLAGRAGWWAYAIGGLLVAAVVWGAAMVGYAYQAHLDGSQLTLTPIGLMEEFGLAFPVIAAAIAAREVTIWFGAWIGARGRRVTRANAEAIAEYESALAEAQAKQP